MSVALVALVVAIASPAMLSQKGSSHADGGTSRRLVVELPADASDHAESSDTLVLPLVLPADAGGRAPRLVQIACDDGRPRDPAVFPHATPRRGPPRA